MVRRLFECCLDIVARNICLVESFIGFPDTVGQQIFQAVDEAHKFDLENLADAHCALSLFSAAYGDQVLSAINIEGQHLMLANCLELVMVFSYIRELDVSSCSLGNHHELLYHISTLQRLEKLSLRNNSLSDGGIQRWTAPIRVKKTGPKDLRILDVADNENISARSLKFLRVFSQLQFLNASSTGVQQGQELTDFAQSQSLQVLTSLSQQQQWGLMDMLEIQTQGWAKGVISGWIHHTQQTCRHRTRPNVSKASRFYGRKGKGLLCGSLTSVSPRSKRPREQARLSLVLVNGRLISHLAAGTKPAAFVSHAELLACRDIHLQSQSTHCPEQTSALKSDNPELLNMPASCGGVNRSQQESGIRRQLGTVASVNHSQQESGIRCQLGTVASVNRSQQESGIRCQLGTVASVNRSQQESGIRCQPGTVASKHPTSASSLTVSELYDNGMGRGSTCVMPSKRQRNTAPRTTGKVSCQLRKGGGDLFHHGLNLEGGHEKEFGAKENCGGSVERELSDELTLLSQYV